MLDPDSGEHVRHVRVGGARGGVDPGEEGDVIGGRCVDRWCRDGVEVVRRRRGNGGGNGHGATALVGDRARGPRRELEALERDLVGVRVAAARAGDDAHPDTLAHVARRLLHEAFFERRALVDPELEVEVSPVRASFERRAEDLLQRPIGQPETLREEPLRLGHLHADDASRRAPPTPPLCPHTAAR